MSTAPYNVQQLAVQAYGWINGSGTSAAGFGCSMTRQASGVYRLTLGPSAGVLEGQSWIMATPVVSGLSGGVAAGVLARVVTPSADPAVPTVRTFYVTDSGGVAVSDTDLEVIVFKTSIDVNGV